MSIRFRALFLLPIMSVAITACVSDSSDDLSLKDYAWASVDSVEAGVSDLHWSGSRFIGVGTAGQILTSSDGFTWAEERVDTAYQLTAVAGPDSLLVALGTDWLGDGEGVWVSAHGGPWERVRQGPPRLSGIAWSGQRFVAIGASGVIMVSSDGRTWSSRVSQTTETLNDIVWSGNQFIAVGSNGAIVTSLTGNLWESRNSGLTSDLQTVIWTGSRLVAQGASDTILHSSDAVTWLKRAMVWTGRHLIAVGSYATAPVGAVAYSPDGLNWTADTERLPKGLVAVTSNGTIAVAAGISGGLYTGQ
jgi:hypothetical protein